MPPRSGRRSSDSQRAFMEDIRMTKREVVLCAPVRTAIGTFNGSLKAMPATELGATVIRETLRRAKLDPAKISTVVMGNVIQAGNKMNPGPAGRDPWRRAGRRAGDDRQPRLRLRRPGDRLRRAGDLARHGRRAVAGGMENMDAAPYLMSGGRWGYRMGDAEIYDSMLRDGLNDAFSDKHSGWHTEDLVTKYQITREDQDRWAERSQQRFSAAQAAGKFEDEIVAVELYGRKGPGLFEKDEHNRPDTTMEASRQAETSLPQGRHHHRRQRAGPQHRCRCNDRC